MIVNEKDLLKVLKMNKDDADSLLSTVRKYNNEWEKNNEENEAYLKSLEEKLGIDLSNIPMEKCKYEKNITSVPTKWDDIVDEANERYKSDINFEDILSSEQIVNAYKRVNEYNKEFSMLTKLNSKDMAFLFTAVALQCIRQYVLDPLWRKYRQGAKSSDERGPKSNATPGWYYVPTNQILINRVPFDAQDYNHSNHKVEGLLKGVKDHRYITLGHDPILGWIFGTANILTSTITTYNLRSAHVKNNPNPPHRNYIHSPAANEKIVEAVINRFNEGKDGKIACGLAILKEAKHLMSDANTKDSLPIPGTMVLSPTIAEKLANYGIDTASVGISMSGSIIINSIIAMVHGLLFDMDDLDNNKELYQVRTRKILLYSNIIASTSNVIATYITKNSSILDVGGILVSIGRLFSDVKFITCLKQEFVEGKLLDEYKGTEEEMKKIYIKRFGI